MSKPNIDQSHMVIQALANNVNWEILIHSTLQKIVDDPKEAGKQFTIFLKNGGKVIVSAQTIINIDRSKPFDPTTFIGNGFSIDEQDDKSLALTEIDLTKVMFDTTLEKGEKTVKGENKLKRLKEKNVIRLDVGIFKELWENQHLTPEKWKENTNKNTTFLFFDGSILRNSNDDRFVLCLYWNGGRWVWSYYWLGNDFNVSIPSAVLASSTLV